MSVCACVCVCVCVSVCLPACVSVSRKRFLGNYRSHHKLGTVTASDMIECVTRVNSIDLDLHSR